MYVVPQLQTLELLDTQVSNSILHAKILYTIM